MKILQTVNMDLARKGAAPRIDAVQDDKYSRDLQLVVYENEKPWPIPHGTTVIVHYQKPDGTGGSYNLLPDGSVAWTVADNLITVALAPQVCTVPGIVQMAVSLYCAEQEITTFPVFVAVQQKPGLCVDSENYFEVQGWLSSCGWEPNMLLGTDEEGMVVTKSPSNSAKAVAIDYDQNVKAIAHRGYSATAPENTIPAYVLAKKNGFNYAECDISFTSDGVAVLLHDSTIDRTSNGSGSISGMTYAQAAQYDFGNWKSADYAGTKIATFSEFIMVCKALCLHPYIELKNNGAYTQEQITGIVSAVKAHGMRGKVTYISYSMTFLGYVKDADPEARLGYLRDTNITESTIQTALTLRTEKNEVFMDVSNTFLTDEIVRLCMENDLPLEIWTVNDAGKIESMNPYITGVTSDRLIAGKILNDLYMTYEAPDVEIPEDPETPQEPEDPEIPEEPEKTLTSISAVYSGSSVPVGTDVNDLTGVAVTAHYSDGSQQNVTGFILSGTIAEGNNTVTATYQGKTATFTVTGLAQSGGESGEDTGEDTGGEVDDTLLYSWNFTNNNLSDSVNGVVASTNAQQKAEGIAFVNNHTYIKLGENAIAMADRTVEIDMASMSTSSDESRYGRLFCIANTNVTATNTGASAFLWGNLSRGWEFYSGSAWGNSYDTTLTSGAFNGKTVQLYFDAKMYCTLYVDGVSYGTSSVASVYDSGWLVMGGTNGDYLSNHSPVVRGVRIYKGNRTEA